MKEKIDDFFDTFSRHENNEMRLTENSRKYIIWSRALQHHDLIQVVFNRNYFWSRT